MAERDLKKGSAELVILSLVEARPRHGYELSKLIESRSEGVVRYNVASLYPLLYRLEQRKLLDCPIVGVAVDDWTVEDRGRLLLLGQAIVLDVASASFVAAIGRITGGEHA